MRIFGVKDGEKSDGPYSIEINYWDGTSSKIENVISFDTTKSGTFNMTLGPGVCGRCGKQHYREVPAYSMNFDIGMAAGGPENVWLPDVKYMHISRVQK